LRSGSVRWFYHTRWACQPTPASARGNPIHNAPTTARSAGNAARDAAPTSAHSHPTIPSSMDRTQFHVSLRVHPRLHNSSTGHAHHKPHSAVAIMARGEAITASQGRGRQAVHWSRANRRMTVRHPPMDGALHLCPVCFVSAAATMMTPNFDRPMRSPASIMAQNV
jgi:hypothetical protein